MEASPSGLVPASDFLSTHLKPRMSFNYTAYGSPPPLTCYTAKGEPVTTPSLRTPPSAHNRHILYTVHEFHPLLDSSSIASPGWTSIATCLQHNYAHYDAFVVLHGTDSLSYTASALSFMLLNLGKPVILTGSQSPFSRLHTDATDNLLGALLLAGHRPIPEVCLFFAHSLYRGNRSTKVSASAFAAFASPNFPPLARVDATRVRVAWHRVRKPPPRDEDGNVPPLRVRATLDTGRVACLRLFPGIKAAMLDAVIRVPEILGLVLETFGAGNAPAGEDGAIVRVLAEAVKRDVVIVNVTQCMEGSVSATYEAGRMLSEAGVVVGRDLTSEAALSKLAFLLAGMEEDGGGTAGVRERMGRSLRGEMS